MWINWFLRVPEINWVLVNSLAFGISNSKQFRICTNVMSYTTSNPIFPITTSHSHSQNMFVPAPQCVAPVTKQTRDEMLHVPPPGHTDTPRWLVLTATLAGRSHTRRWPGHTHPSGDRSWMRQRWEWSTTRKSLGHQPPQEEPSSGNPSAWTDHST